MSIVETNIEFDNVVVVPNTGPLFPRLAMSRRLAGMTPEERRRIHLRFSPGAMFLSDQAEADYVAGKCVLREYLGVPIIDYTGDHEPH